jgi:hypothetical protein
MAWAESGDYQQAAAIQRNILAVARRAGDAAAVRRLEENLQLYESGRPCRTFWTDDTPPRR